VTKGTNWMAEMETLKNCSKREIHCPDCGRILGVVEGNGDFVSNRRGRVIRLVHGDVPLRVDILCECGKETKVNDEPFILRNLKNMG